MAICLILVQIGWQRQTRIFSSAYTQRQQALKAQHCCSHAGRSIDVPVVPPNNDFGAHGKNCVWN